MASFFRFAVFSLVLVALLVFVVVPAVASPLLTQMLRDTGLRGDDLNVSLDYFDPSLLTGRAEHLTVRGENVELPPALVGSLDVTLGGVSLLDRTFDSISGELNAVTLAAGGLTVEVASVEVDGPADAAAATARFGAEETQELVELAARREGLPLDDVRLVEGGLRVTLAGAEIEADIGVQGGALVLAPGIGQPILLLQPAPSDPWRLSEAFVSPSGVTVRGLFDAASLSSQLWSESTE